MDERVPYGKRNYYPNLRPEDLSIWERFLNRYPTAYVEVIYNLHVGEGAPIPEGTDPDAARSFKALTQYKIDVVGFRKDGVDIIELKPRAGAGALGQLLTYVELYKRDVDPTAMPRPVIITDVIRPDLPLVAEKLGVQIIAV